jgi:hypothetical protein
MFPSPHHTGHITARDGRLLRLDVVRSRGRSRWVATRYNLDLTIHDVFYGTEEQAHQMMDHWRGVGG